MQEQLSDEVFARAYGFAFPASIGGIALGALVAGYAVWLYAVAATTRAHQPSVSAPSPRTSPA